MKYWSIGVLEYWSIGVLEYWAAKPTPSGADHDSCQLLSCPTPALLHHSVFGVSCVVLRSTRKTLRRVLEFRSHWSGGHTPHREE
jgi:hypothetical protein